jgi:sugar lactone lactonase YvrE
VKSRAGAVDLLVDARADVAESPVWDADKSSLLWVDITAGLVHRTSVTTTQTASFAVGQPVGAVALADDETLVLAVRDGLAMGAWGAPSLVVDLVAEHPGGRMNDGKCDPAGRFWAGSLNRERPGTASLYRLDRELRAHKMLSGVTTSNGIGWSPDGRRMYYVDTGLRQVDVFDFATEHGEIANRRCFARIDDGSSPDGLTVDAEGCVWVACFRGAGIRRYAPDGRLVDFLPMPVSRVTSCTFGGEDLNVLFITSARRGLTPAALAEEPLAGGVFAYVSDTTGLPPSRFCTTVGGGSTTDR